MVYLAIAVICAVIALEVGLRVKQYNYIQRKEIDQIRAMRGFEMDVQEKRKLLEAIDILVRRPMMADETTLGNAIGYFIKLIEESTHGQITLVPTVKQ